MQPLYSVMAVLKLSLVTLFLVLLGHSTCSGQSLGDIFTQEIKEGPPVRPKAFKTVQEAQDYLAALRDYYSVISRPRFGRSVDRQLYEAAKQRMALADREDFKL